MHHVCSEESSKKEDEKQRCTLYYYCLWGECVMGQFLNRIREKKKQAQGRITLMNMISVVYTDGVKYFVA